MKSHCQDVIIDFEQFDGQLTDDDELVELGMSFGSTNLNLDLTSLNGSISPVNVQPRDGAFSGSRVALNCTNGIACEFPSGAVLMEFEEVPDSVTFWLNGLTDDGTFYIYSYDLDGNLRLVETRPSTGSWQFFMLTKAKGIIIDTERGTGGTFSYWLDDVGLTWLPTNLPPIAQIEATPLQGIAPLEVAFTASGSIDPDGDIVSYQWDFGDGTSSTGFNTNHIYADTGSYTAVLTVVDDQFSVDTAALQILVLDLSIFQICGAEDGLDERLLNDEIFIQETKRIEDMTINYIRNIAQDTPYGMPSSVITIPVVVHVVYKNENENISDEQILSQIDALNEYFRASTPDLASVPGDFVSIVADMRIEFALAKRLPYCQEPVELTQHIGITRTETMVDSFDFREDTIKLTHLGGKTAWPSDKYLNIWVCDLAGITTLGHSSNPADQESSPELDGIVVDYTVFGVFDTSNGPYMKGGSAAHEIGHWLNLKHIWGRGIACYANDCVDDTPTQLNYGSGLCSSNGSSPFECYACPMPNDIPNTCPVIEGHGEDPNDLYVNLMGYTHDECRSMFTLGQQARAAATLFGVRASVIGSDALSEFTSTADLWSQDTPDDTGVEPNDSRRAMYQSADIWVRNDDDGMSDQEHENPIYKESGDSNYVYVRVRNRGCDGAQSGVVKLYWAKASSNLGWPAPWDGSVRSPAIMGGPIGEMVVTVQAGDFTVLKFPWLVPDPADYADFGADQTHFCLLSRIETDDGMTYSEASNLYANVKNNNNIVWKNLSIATTGEEQEEDVILSDFLVGNYQEEEQLFDLLFDLPEDERLSLFNWGEVTVDLGDLYPIWINNGGGGKKIDILENQMIRLNGPEARIGELRLPPQTLFNVRVMFDKDSAQTITNVFKLNMDQQDHMERMVVGGMQFVFKTIADGVRLPGIGNIPVELSCPQEIPENCPFPLSVSVDMSRIQAPDDLLGNITARISWDTSSLSFLRADTLISGFEGVVHVDSVMGQLTFAATSVEGQGDTVEVFRALFTAKGNAGTTIRPQLEILTMASAATFTDLLNETNVNQCATDIVPVRILGDIDANGLVNSTDAALILASLVGLDISQMYQERIKLHIGDIDLNGRTDALDALLLLSFDVGLDVDHPIGIEGVCPELDPLLIQARIDQESLLPVPVTISYSTDKDGLTVFPVWIDMDTISQALGTYHVDFQWDTEIWQFEKWIESQNSTFKGALTDLTGIDEGRIKVVNANPFGADGLVHIGSIALRKTKYDPKEIDLGFSVNIHQLGTARTFRALTPVLNILTKDQDLKNSPLNSGKALQMWISPNPMRDQSSIVITVDKPQEIDLLVYDLHGRLLHQIATDFYVEDSKTFEWDGMANGQNRAPVGTYLIRCQGKDHLVAEKVVVLGN